ncbi:hypothetical protein WJX81_005224 [Elliptochloris bilobata]|uniref:Chalcone isomerase domain-containing protein n=1 Tax=Elliptochloris bilobata TaxID=381761 RepID=A0AAW1QK39_9CHLO
MVMEMVESDPRLWIQSVTFVGLPDLLGALAGARGAHQGQGLGSEPGRVARALLAVFQRGRQVWSGAAHGGATARVEVGVMVEGDVIIGLWLGDHKGEFDAPTLSYAFHTAFAPPGIMLRAAASDLDLLGGHMLVRHG